MHESEDASDATWEDVAVVASSPHILREFRERWAAWTPPTPSESPLPLSAPDVVDPTGPIAPVASEAPGARRSVRSRRPSRKAFHSS